MSSISEKEALAAARNAEQLREKELRAKEWEALKLEREARKKEEERLEEIERKRLAEVHFQQEKQVPCPVCLLKQYASVSFQKKKSRRSVIRPFSHLHPWRMQAQQRAAYEEKQRKIEAEAREQERMKRAEELKRQTEAIFAEQQRQADERKRQMEEKDSLRKAAMERQRKEALVLFLLLCIHSLPIQQGC